MNRLDVAFLLFVAFACAVYVHGVEQTAYGTFLILSGLWIYSNISKNMK